MMNKTLLVLGAVVALAAAIFLAQNAYPPVPGMNGENRECLSCHRQSNINTNAGVRASQAFCNSCHGLDNSRRVVDGIKVSMQVPADNFDGNPHQYVACIHCHTDVARSPHQTEVGAQCRACHTVHGEGQAHAPHLNVTCQACHSAYPGVTRDATDGVIRLARFDNQQLPISLTDHRLLPHDGAQVRDGMCRKCHFEANSVGAPAAILPPKSVLCIVCHNAPLALGHWMFPLAFIIAAIGFLMMVSFWFKGSVGEEQTSLHRKVALGAETLWQVIFSRRVFKFLGVFILDVILQRRILQESVQRWVVHSLIYTAFLLRLSLSLVTLVIFNVAPDSSLALMLIDKNHWLVAFANDLLGTSMLVGVLWAATLRFYVRPTHVLSEGRDNAALIIVGLLVISGFVLEGMRILITQTPPATAAFAFGGYFSAKLLAAVSDNWQNAYGYMWYFHGLTWAVFIAYLPFGKLKHVVTTPVSLLVAADSNSA